MRIVTDDFAALCANEPELADLRASVRDFLVADRVEFGWAPSVDAWLSSWDEEFSARLGDAGFLGLTIPREYGGQGLSHLHRYVVTEELLAAGAPVAAHWIADRQVAPGLLAYGSEQQRQRLLPKIAAGRYFSAIGMSEPQAGSDLAAAAAKATRTDGGWVLSGTKVWTSGAHLAHQIVVLARTSPVDPDRRHAGFSQFIVPTDLPGISISSIVLMSGEHHFNEVTFDDVWVPAENLIGGEGDGWAQVGAELAYERSGPERYMSCSQLLLEMLDAGDADDARQAEAIGRIVASYGTLRQMSLGVASMLARGENPALAASLVKDQGALVEQAMPDTAHALFGGRVAPGSTLDQAMRYTTLAVPSFSLRGGTREILRGIIAKGLDLR